MKHPIQFALVIAAALSLGACGKSDEPAEEAAAPATGAAEETKTDVEKALDDAREKGREAADAAVVAAGKLMESAREKGGEIAENAKMAGAEVAETANVQAEALLAKAREYIENNETDLAGQAMEKLRALKASLSASAQAQVEQLEQMLAASESGAEPSPQGQ